MSDLVRELRAKAQQSTRTDKRWDDHVAWRGADEIERLSASNAELLEALKPFVAADVYDDPPDNQAISGGPCAPLITYGDLRAASRVHDKHEGTD